jgi:integrase
MAGHIKPRKTKDGKTRYQARIPDPMRPGKDIVQTFDRRGDASEWLTMQASAMQLGSFIDPRRAKRPTREVVDAWRETWADLEPKTRVGYESMLAKHVLPEFGDAPVGGITSRALQRHFNELADVLAPKTLRNVYGVFSGVFRIAREHRYIAGSPLDAVKLPRGGQRSRRMLFLTPAEVRKLADAMPTRRLRVALLVAAYQGPRAGELWALRRRDVDQLRTELHFRNAIKEINSAAATLDGLKGLIVGPTKTHADRKNKMPRFLADELAALLAEPSPRAQDGTVLVIRDTKHGPTFERSPDPFDPDAVVFATERGNAVRHNLFYKRTFRPLIAGSAARPTTQGRRARPAVPGLWPKGHPLHRLRWHDLRHTCAALSLSIAPNLSVVKERLGHDDIRTTINTYGHLLPSVDAALADGLDALYTTHDDDDAPGNIAELRRQDPEEGHAEAA